MKRYNKDVNVCEAAVERLEIIFKEFDNISVSFSGGKDSGVMLNLVIDYMRKNDIKNKISVMHIDYEAQYQMTTDYVDDTFEKNKDIIDYYRICMPIKAQCATSMYQDHWIPWEPEKRDIWVRDLPVESINIDNHSFDFWKDAMWDYELQNEFSRWLHKKNGAKTTAILVGIRTQESLNRWRAIFSERNQNKYKSYGWTNEVYTDVYNAYPIYDWLTSDVWVANAKFGYEYNELYDLFHQAGLTIDQMRVASPFNDYAKDSLHLYRVIDPNNWGRMISRVNGVNFTGIYGTTTAMGWRSIELPEGHTWESYMYFLLSTLPEHTRENYLQKLETSIKFWREKGGVLSDEAIQKLKDEGVQLEVGSKTNYQTEKLPVRMEYIDEIDMKDFNLIPSYKRMCICIMKNDHVCKYMGFSQTKDEVARRKNIIAKYNKIL